MAGGGGDWRSFYASPLGLVAQAALAARLRSRWGDVRSLSVLGVGYAAPYLVDLQDARRRVSVEVDRTARPSGGVRAAADALPFADATFDRVLLVHALEESADADATAREAARVLASSGRMMVAAVARFGLWANVGATPLRRGRPWTAPDLSRRLRAAGLEVTGRTRLLHTPPFPALLPYSGPLERAGVALGPAFGGLVVVEAMRRDFVRPKLRPATAPATVGAVVRPARAASTPRQESS